MKVNVISISNTNRSSKAIERLVPLGFEPKIIQALDCRNRDLDDLRELFDIEEFRVRYGRLPSPGEIGCSLSHLLAIKGLRNNEGVIFEDDAIPLCDGTIFKSIYKEILLSPFDIVVLGYSKANENTEEYFNLVNPFLPITNTAKTPFAIGVRYQHSTSGAVGYVVKKKGTIILSRLTKISHLADDWGYYSSLGICIGYLNPTLVREDVLGVKSTLGHDTGFITPKDHKFYFIRTLLIFRRKLLGFYRLCIMKIKLAGNKTG